MKMLWKIMAIGGVLLAILALGTAVVLAQEPEEAPFSDEDGDGLCDHCGEVPDSLLRKGRRPGQRGSGMMGFRSDGSSMRGSTIIATAADQLGMTVEEVTAERASGNSIADLAGGRGVQVQDIIAAYLEERGAALDASVGAGQVTREQADAIMERAAEMALDQVNQAGHHDPGFRAGGVPGMMGAGNSSMLEVLAQELGLTVDEVIAELQTGIRIAELAAGHGVQAQDIVSALLAEREAWLLEAVAAGRITQERSDLMMSQMEEMIEDHVNQPWTEGAGNGCGRGLTPRSGGRPGSGSSNRLPGGRGRGMGTSGDWSGPMFQGQDA